MTNDQAYAVISKHLFVASRRYSEDFRPVIILAENIDDAKEKAQKHFGIDVAVWQPTKTVSPDVLKV
jgi:hypothetical protein